MSKEDTPKGPDYELKEPLIIELDPFVLPSIDKYAKRVKHDYGIFQKDVERRMEGSSRNDLQTIIGSDHSERLNSSIHMAAIVFGYVTEALRKGENVVINPLEQTDNVRPKGFTVVAYSTTYDIGSAGVDEFLSVIFPTPEDDHTWESPNGLVRKKIKQALDSFRPVHLKLSQQNKV